MRIAVCIKHVPDSTAPRRIDPATKRLDRSGSGAPNPTDMNALEEALRIRDAAGGEVFTVTMGPAEAMESVRKALAMGADRAVLVTDDGAAGSDLLGTARVLAAAIAREAEPVDLVLTGQQAGDSDGAVLWAALAELLARPVISQVAELTVEDGSVTGKRQTELGYEVIRAPLPAVIAVSDAINEPRYPSLKGIMGAKKKPTDRLSLGDLGVGAGEVGEAGARTAVTALGEPPSRGDRVMVEDEDGSGAQKILDFLIERRLV
jgi:electron transfer flavoprotein beta subunit